MAWFVISIILILLGVFVLLKRRSINPGVQYQNCLNLIRDLAAKGQLQSLPQAFSCSTTGTPVIIGSK